MLLGHDVQPSAQDAFFHTELVTTEFTATVQEFYLALKGNKNNRSNPLRIGRSGKKKHLHTVHFKQRDIKVWEQIYLVHNEQSTFSLVSLLTSLLLLLFSNTSTS